jgi:alkanesulfonate monooxygenase SsuD/methylene tetrahydromethanopterin reductase-like flavin-dependent oxidoreductase (luciferase family)
VVSLDVGVLLPTIGHLGNEVIDIRPVARHAEDVGLDSVWAGDHLTMGGAPLLECMLSLAAVASVTERVQIGCSVLLAGMRGLVWTAKQVATLQFLSGNRLEFGIGVGAKWPEEWAAAGIPLSDRGRRADDFLAALPRLLAGEPIKLVGLPQTPEVTMRPSVPMPPLWVGGRSRRAMRRTVDFDAGWLTTVSTPDEIRAQAAELGELAAEREKPAPRLGTMIYASLTAHDSDGAEVAARRLAAAYSLPIAHTRLVAVGGSPEQAAEGLAAYRAAGVDQFVVALVGTRWREQYELLSRTRELLTR